MCICEYVFMFQSVCALRVCVHGEACQGQSAGENMWPGRTRARALEGEEEKKSRSERRERMDWGGKDKVRQSVGTEKITEEEINSKLKRNNKAVLRKREKEKVRGKEREERRKKLKNKRLRDLASHPPTITAPHVRHCEGRKNKNDKGMEKGTKWKSQDSIGGKLGF